MKSKPKRRAEEAVEPTTLATDTAPAPAGHNGGPPLEPEFDLLTETEAAAILHWAVSTLQKDRGQTVRVPFVKLGKRVLYQRSALQAFIAANVRRTPAVVA
jgi:hypothetical protein